MAARQGGRRRWWPWILGAALAVLAAGAAAAIGFAGPILRPFVEAQAALALGRPVSIGRLQVSLGRATTAMAEDVVIGNPPGFPAEATPWFARIARLRVTVEPLAWLRDGSLVVPRVEVEQPRAEARALNDGRANYIFDPPSDEGEEAPRIRIGAVLIRDGRAHVVLDPLEADFTVEVATEEPPDAPPRILATAQGTYAAQPVQARLVGGGILTLRDADNPWPLRLDIVNGRTEVRLEGTLRDPLALRGADLRLTAAGPDMALLRPISGVRFPETPPYRLTGRFDYAPGRIRLMDAEGHMGRTDLSGGLIVTLAAGARPVLAAELASRRLDLRDLAGFVGAEPGRPSDPEMTPERRRALAQAAADPRLLPESPVNIPKLLAADVHVDYRAEHIEGRGVPFDALVTQFDIVGGVVDVKRLVFPIGGGELAGRFTLTPREDGTLQARGEAELRRADFARLMGAAGVRGGGTIGGVARVEGTGRSLSEIVARGTGSMTVVMVGGTLSAFLVDLSGLRFGNALFSLIGLPERERVECLIGEFALARGRLSARTLLVDTESAVISGAGEMTLPAERLRLRLRTESKRPSIGTLPTPILVSGTLKQPTAAPEMGELAARAGAAAGLAALLPPLAVLPTIQLGVGENAQCERLQARGGGGGGRGR